MKNKKYLIIISVFVLIVTSSLIYLSFIKNNSSPSEGNQSFSSPPTELEQKAGDDIKSSQPDATEPSQPQPESKEATQVLISDANQYADMVEVRAFMPSVIQDGDCLLTFRLEDKVVSINENAYADASSTICTAGEISVDDFAQSGSWELTVSYESDNYYGSANTTVEITK